MTIDWGQLALVLAVGLVSGAGLVIVFALGVAALSRATEPGRTQRGRRLGFGLFGLCIAIPLGGVAYGIYILVAPELH